MKPLRRVPLYEVSSAPATWNPRTSGSRESIRYIDISGVSAADKNVSAVRLVLPAEAPSRARQIVEKNDVLVSTVRPNLNAVAIVPPDLDGATASTGFAVLRPDSAQLDARYLFHWVRSAAFVRHLTARASGASYPAVTERVVRESKLPLPTVHEQRRIAAMLDGADGIRRKQRERISLFDGLLQSIFRETFGDPVRNEKGWVRAEAAAAIRLIEAGTSVSGAGQPSPGGWGVLKISAVTSGWYLPGEAKAVAALPDRPIFPKRGDLLFSRANTRELVAATCLVDRDEDRLFLPDKLWRITANSEIATAEYLRCLFADSGFRQVLTQKATGSSGSMLNVSQDKVLRVHLPLPPVELQRQFADIVWKINGLRHGMLSARARAEELLEALAEHAFGRQAETNNDRPNFS